MNWDSVLDVQVLKELFKPKKSPSPWASIHYFQAIREERLNPLHVGRTISTHNMTIMCK